MPIHSACWVSWSHDSHSVSWPIWETFLFFSLTSVTPANYKQHATSCVDAMKSAGCYWGLGARLCVCECVYVCRYGHTSAPNIKSTQSLRNCLSSLTIIIPIQQYLKSQEMLIPASWPFQQGVTNASYVTPYSAIVYFPVHHPGLSHHASAAEKVWLFPPERLCWNRTPSVMASGCGALGGDLWPHTRDFPELHPSPASWAHSEKTAIFEEGTLTINTVGS